jgi:IS5 family transposase
MGAALKQTTFSTSGFDRYAKTTKRAVFLAQMDQVVPWAALCGLVEPFYPKGETGRRPFGVERRGGWPNSNTWISGISA